jgi:hypothetical protein
MLIDRKKTCVLIGAHPQNSNDSALLSLTIEGIKRQGYKICLVSHSPVNIDIQKSVNYYVYSDENEILTLPLYSNSVIFSNYTNYHYQSNLGNKLGTTHYASLINLKNGLNLLKEKGFSHFIYHNYDYFLNQKDHTVLETQLKDLTNLDYWFMNDGYDRNSLFPILSIYAGKITYFLDLINVANSPETYLKYCGSNYILEFFVKHRIKDCEGIGIIENFRPSDIFTSKWAGIADTKGLHLPDYDVVNAYVDLVRDYDNENHIYGILPLCNSSHNVVVNLYKNDVKILSNTLKLGSMYWWWYKTNDNDKWKIECLLSERIISSVERSSIEILSNKPSFLKFKNNNNITI